MILSVADAQAECRRRGVDLRVSGKGASDCVDLIQPFCAEAVRVDTSRALPFCVTEKVSPAKAASELKEAELRQAALAATRLSPLLVGGILLAFAVGAWFALRD